MPCIYTPHLMVPLGNNFRPLQSSGNLNTPITGQEMSAVGRRLILNYPKLRPATQESTFLNHDLDNKRSQRAAILTRRHPCRRKRSSGRHIILRSHPLLAMPMTGLIAVSTMTAVHEHVHEWAQK